MRSIPNHIVLLLIFLLISCERERILPYTPTEPLIAMHAVIETGSDLTVQLERTGNLSDPDEKRSFLPEADFEIQWNEEIYSFTAITPSEDDRFNFTGITPLPGDFIRIRAHSKGLKQVTGEVSVPQTVFTYLNSISVDETFLNPRVHASIQLAQEQAPSAYFMIYAEGVIQNSLTGELENRRFRVSSSDPLIEKRLAESAKSPGDFIFVPSAGEGLKSLDLQISGIPGNFSPKQPKQALDLVIAQLSPELYEYYISLYRSSLSGFPSESSIQPMDLYSNINGGLGIVGSSQSTKLSLYW